MQEGGQHARTHVQIGCAVITPLKYGDVICTSHKVGISERGVVLFPLYLCKTTSVLVASRPQASSVGAVLGNSKLKSIPVREW